MNIFESKIDNKDIEKENHCIVIEVTSDGDIKRVVVNDSDIIQNVVDSLESIRESKNYVRINDLGRLLKNVDATTLGGEKLALNSHTHDDLAPIHHQGEEYGVADVNNYGHVKGVVTPLMLKNELDRIKYSKDEAKKNIESVVKEWGNYRWSFIGDPQGAKPRFKHWGTVKDQKSILRCGPEGKKHFIATKTGSYKIPAPLVFSEFHFNIPPDAQIVSIYIEYKDAYKAGAGDFRIDAPKIIVNAGKNKSRVQQTLGAAAPLNVKNVKGKYQIHGLSVGNATAWRYDDVNKISVTFKYPENETYYQGELYFKDFKLTVKYKK